MKNINEYLLTEPLNTKYKGERTDEVIGLLLASSLLAYACYPLFTKKGPIGSFFYLTKNFINNFLKIIII